MGDPGQRVFPGRHAGLDGTTFVNRKVTLSIVSPESGSWEVSMLSTIALSQVITPFGGPDGLNVL